MRKISLIIATTLSVIIFWACNEKTLLPDSMQNKITDNARDETDPELEKLYEKYIGDYEKITAFMKENSPKTEQFVIDAEAGTEKEPLFTQNGTQFRIPSNAFVYANGKPVSGAVDISIIEVFKPSDMLLTNKTTITDNGELLTSFGEMRLDARQNGENLALADGVAIEVVINPEKAELKGELNEDKLRQGIPIWTGDTTITYQQHNFNCNADSYVSSFQVTNPLFRWVLDNTTSPAVVTQPDPSNGITSPQISFNIYSLGKWTNIDALYHITSTRITVTGVFNNNNYYNPATSNRNQTSEPTALFFKPNGYNTLIGLNGILSKDPNINCGNGFYSIINSIPEGLTGTFIAYSVVNGQFYMDFQSGVTIQHNHVNTLGGKVMKLNFDPKPVSEADLISAIRKLDNL